ncbi:hypothetical protein EDB80DRAFT_722166 [Ilyonectria destructans]|nr:hypothetical protein EDB80DRAFT_722166 [Ilyonectria destructans]
MQKNILLAVCTCIWYHPNLNCASRCRHHSCYGAICAMRGYQNTLQMGDNIHVIDFKRISVLWEPRLCRNLSINGYNGRGL